MSRKVFFSSAPDYLGKVFFAHLINQFWIFKVASVIKLLHFAVLSVDLVLLCPQTGLLNIVEYYRPVWLLLYCIPRCITFATCVEMHIIFITRGRWGYEIKKKMFSNK